MLVLGIKNGQCLSVGDAEIRIYTREGGLKVTVDAPRSVPIHRGSLKQVKTMGKVVK